MASSVWNNAEDTELSSEITVSSLRMMTEEQQQSILFKAIRACDLHIIRNVLQVNRTLLNAKMFGYEGTDVFEVIKNSKMKRCYSYTGLEKDGFFYPLHVAAETGHKNLTILLVKAGADIQAVDYRGRTAEENCNGNALHAFYELRGFSFGARERYQGKLDRQGIRTGQGILFYKPEGYMQEEKQLYRGSFKQGVYHGHGTLYYPGSDVIAYIGRFKEGLKHGRGIEFDRSGHKSYQGTFREDKREGRGEEFAPFVSELSASSVNSSTGQNTRIYKGEFLDNVRHGFGVAYYSEGSKYFGRYEHNLMSGVGIYVHPDGNRFEGMFYNNKADGVGSFYERDPFTGNFTGTHALWQAGKKIKDGLATPFVPTLADLPDDTTKTLFQEIMKQNSSGSNRGHGQLLDPDAEKDDICWYNCSKQDGSREENGEGEDHEGAVKKKKEKWDFTYYDREENMQLLNKTDWWKVQLGKYMKLSLQEAPLIGLPVPAAVLAHIKALRSGGDKTNDDSNNPTNNAGNNGNESDSDDEVDEVIGYHFMDCTTLFASYIYVTSASKVFEDRLVHQGLTAEFPDFEAVYHLVIDAVDTYNDSWELAYRMQNQSVTASATSGLLPTTPQSNSTSSGTTPMFSHINPQIANSALDIESRRLMFMTEKEKKAEQVLKQRAELAVKKGTAELDSKIEKSIASEVLATLEQELAKLLRVDLLDSEESVHMNLPIAARKNLITTEGSSMNLTAGMTSPNFNSNNSYSSNNTAQNNALSGNNKMNSVGATTNSNPTKKSPGPPSVSGSSAPKKKDSVLKMNVSTSSTGSTGNDSAIVNLEDLFDLDNFSTTMTSTNNDDTNNNNVTNNNIAPGSNADGDEGGSNEFAAELLYIMRLSMSLT